MYSEQQTIFDREERKAFVDDMQDFLYEQIPEMVLVYPNYLQAYRTDAFTGYVPDAGRRRRPALRLGPVLLHQPDAGLGGRGRARPRAAAVRTPSCTWASRAVVLADRMVLRRHRRRRADEDRV